MIKLMNNKVFAYNPTTSDLQTVIGRFNYIRPKHIHIIFDLDHLINYQVYVSLGYYEKYEKHWLAYLFDKIKPYLRDTENVINPNKDTHITFTLISNKTNIPLKDLVEMWMSYYNIKPSNQFSYFVQPTFMFTVTPTLYCEIYLNTFDKSKSKYLWISKEEYLHRLEFAKLFDRKRKEENNNG